MIYMNDCAYYYMFKITAVYCYHVRLIGIDWPVQSLDLIFIKNLW